MGEVPLWDSRVVRVLHTEKPLYRFEKHGEFTVDKFNQARCNPIPRNETMSVDAFELPP